MDSNLDSKHSNQEHKVLKLEYLEPLKPLDVEKLKMKTGSENSKVKEFENSAFTPINVFGSFESMDPKQNTGRLIEHFSAIPKKNKAPVVQREKRSINPLYYKTRSMQTEYNSLMNSLNTKESCSSVYLESNPLTGEEFQSHKEQSFFKSEESLIERSEELKVSNNTCIYSEISEDPIPPKVLLNKTFSNSGLNSKQREKFASELFEPSEVTASLVQEKFSLLATSLKPKDYELEDSLDILCPENPMDSLIEMLDISKKKCVVWYEGETIPYVKFRENPDHIIFFVGEDAYGYSKKILFEEYSKTRTIYFDLNLNWEDNETLWIPMSQIAKLLEFSHPVYEIQKMKYSMSVWNLIPVKLKK